jgi:FkbM family methyltransferase
MGKGKEWLKDKLGFDFVVRFIWKRESLHGQVNYRLIDHLLKRGMSVIDVGASNGVFTTRFLQLVGLDGVVYAIEPHPANRELLESIAKRHPQVWPEYVAASDRSGTAHLVVPIQNGIAHTGLSRLDPDQTRHDVETFVVETRRLDDIVPQLNAISFLKIDVEGHEIQVLQGATRILASRPMLLVEIEQRHSAGELNATVDWILQLGYDGWALFEKGLRPINCFNLERDQTAFLTQGFQDMMPTGYVNDFLFLPSGVLPPKRLIDTTAIKET